MALRSTMTGKSASFVAYREADGTDTPFLCTFCLGPSKNIAMTKMPRGRRCRECSRPCVLFSWRVSSDSRVMKNELCVECARKSNLCQCCCKDFQTGLSKNSKNEMSKEDLELYLERKRVRDADETKLYCSARAKRFQPMLCSYFAKGFCSRGTRCPFRHEQVEEKNKDLLPEQIEATGPMLIEMEGTPI